jgi:hypothetical protein
VQLGRHRSRPRRTVLGMAHGHVGPGPRVQHWRSPRPRGPWTQAVAARAARMRGTGPARPWPGGARAAHGARRRCSASRRRLGTGARRRRGSGGTLARKWRRGVTATGRHGEAAAAAMARLGQRACGHDWSGWRRHSQGSCPRRGRAVGTRRRA